LWNKSQCSEVIFVRRRSTISAQVAKLGRRNGS